MIAVHGGAGRPRHDELPEDAPAGAALEVALAAGHAVLASAGRALDAVEAAVRALEDEPLFNAGRGSVLNRHGDVELDASIMCGATAAAGGVGAVRGVRNPIALARAVLEEGRHALVTGEGAVALAHRRGLEPAPASWFVTARQEQRWRRWMEATAGEGAPAPVEELSTVGAVALDAHGALAAATSTGGLRGKEPGRVGDSAVIGAATWADGHCAVSLTGDGDGILRAAAAHELDALVRHGGRGLAEAADEVVHRRLGAAGVDAGLIALDGTGAVAMPFNGGRMHRGVRRDGAPPWTASGGA